MARSVRLSPSAVVDAAIDVIDARGPDGLTLAAVAEYTGVAAPSLYKHVGSLAELRTLVGVRVMEEMTDRFTRAVMGRSRDDAVAALMRAYREYVVAHPGRYAIAPANPLGNPATAAGGQRLLEVILAVLRGYGLGGADAIHLIRCARVIVHGFGVLESAGGFGLPEDLDETYERLIAMFLAELSRTTG